MVTAMWSVSNRTGTSNSKSAVAATPPAGAVLKVTSPVVVSADQPENCSTPSRYTFDHRAALVPEALARLERLLLLEQGSRELLDLASLLRRRFGREPGQRLGDEPLVLGLHEGRTLHLQTLDHPLVGGSNLLGGLDLLGPQLRELRIPHRRRLRDQLVDLLGVAAVVGPQRLDLGDPALVLGNDPLAALVRDVEQRALELACDPLQVLPRPLASA
jgi:hypothetical protein